MSIKLDKLLKSKEKNVYELSILRVYYFLMHYLYKNNKNFISNYKKEIFEGSKICNMYLTILSNELMFELLNINESEEDLKSHNIYKRIKNNNELEVLFSKLLKEEDFKLLNRDYTNFTNCGFYKSNAENEKFNELSILINKELFEKIKREKIENEKSIKAKNYVIVTEKIQKKLNGEKDILFTIEEIEVFKIIWYYIIEGMIKILREGQKSKHNLDYNFQCINENDKKNILKIAKDSKYPNIEELIKKAGNGFTDARYGKDQLTVEEVFVITSIIFLHLIENENEIHNRFYGK